MNNSLTYGVIPGLEPRAGNVITFANAVLAFGVFLSGFVIFEPAPYELVFAAMLGIWYLAGLKIQKTIVPMVICMFGYSVGGFLSIYQVPEFSDSLIYVAVTFFLGMTSIFFASVIADDMGRLRLIFRAYVVAAVVTSMLGIIGYFDALPGFGMFTLYDRAMGAFQDPNVFGPFLVLPIMYLIYGLLTRSISMAPIRLLVLAILLIGIFLSFSRAAWGLVVISTVLMYSILFFNEQKSVQRLKYIMLAVFGVALIIILLAIALQFEAVSGLFSERARVVQAYDGNRLGRFARHAIGFSWAVEMPLGMGPLQFGLTLGADTHNIWLKSLMAYGWIGLISFLTLVLWTLIGGFKLLFRPRPWQPYFIIAYSVFVGHIIIAWVIDIDHWRHFFLIVGIIWGCMVLEKRWQNYTRTMPAPSVG